METKTGRTQIEAFLAGVEALWACYDQVWAGFKPEDWTRTYGKDWIFADQPFHLEYFDRLVIADPLEAQESLPENERWKLRSMREINEWNGAEIAKRPRDGRVEESITALHHTRDRIRNALSKLSDDDLDRVQVFCHFFDVGFISLRDALKFIVVHNWGEYDELLYRLGRTAPPPPPKVVHEAVAFYLDFVKTMCRPERARKPFTMVWNLTGPGGGTWTIRVANGAATLEEKAAAKPDLTFTCSPTSFNMIMIRRAANPMLGMLSGKVRVRGFAKMGLMKKLFPEPDEDASFDVPFGL